MKKLLTIGVLVCCSLGMSAQQKAYDAPSTGNLRCGQVRTLVTGR